MPSRFTCHSTLVNGSNFMFFQARYFSSDSVSTHTFRTADRYVITSSWLHRFELLIKLLAITIMCLCNNLIFKLYFFLFITLNVEFIKQLIRICAAVVLHFPVDYLFHNSIREEEAHVCIL